MESIFDHESHQVYLKMRLTAHGLKTRFAGALRLAPSYVSQILGNQHSLSLEQADKANEFLRHSPEESEFFFLLVSKDRAGTSRLRKHFEEKIREHKKKRLQVTERLGRKSVIDESVNGTYYASWIYSAAHIACAIDGLNDSETIAGRLGIEKSAVNQVLSFLENNGFLVKKPEGYEITQTWIRLEKPSPHLIKHHSNWRLKAIQNLDRESENDLHYSGLYAIDFKTSIRLKNLILEFLKNQMPAIESAPSQDLYVWNIDLFRMK